MHEFLKAVGASVTAAGDSHFADEPEDLAAFDAVTVITPLSHYGLLAVEGPDSAKFLQGQVTCNVMDATDSRSVAGAYCTPKGRILSSFQLAQRDPQTYWLRMRRDIVDSTKTSLGKYIVFSKAKLRIAEELIPIGLHGPAAAAVIDTLTGLSGDQRRRVAPTAGGLVLQLDDAGQWFECWLPREEALHLWQSQQGRLAAAGSRYWQWLGIRAGLGEICAATVDQFIPQMLNFQVTGAINFKKGCYTGQEIVARTQYRGQIKRHMYRLAVPSPAPMAGTELSAAGQKIGTVVDGVTIAAQTAEILAVLSATEAEQLAANGDSALRLLEVPYAIT
jgi:folate-binding protein YgfZ